MTIDIPIVSSTYYDETRDTPKNGEALLGEQLIINPGAKLQLTELDHESPLFKISDNANATADPNSRIFSNLSAIDGQIYKTSWARLLGTELIVDDYGEVVGTVREHLVTEGTVKSLPSGGAPVEMDVDDKDTAQMINSRSPFFRTALAAAQRKQGAGSVLGE